MATPEASAQEILSLFIATGARPGRSFPTLTPGTPLALSKFPGAIQSAFLAAGYQMTDLVAGLAYALTEGWLSLSPNSSTNAAGDMYAEYELEQAGFSAAGGVAPTQPAAAQQLINVAAALNNTPGGARFAAKYLVASFVGTVGENTFAPEDVMPGYGYALAEGWVKPCGDSLFDPVFALTAAGVAQAT
jgi:hypothetical protein